jgi:hypothetical protein
MQKRCKHIRIRGTERHNPDKHGVFPLWVGYTPNKRLKEPI